MAMTTSEQPHLPRRRRLAAWAQRQADRLEFIRGPLWVLAVVGGSATAVGRLALLFGLERELVAAVGVGLALYRWGAAQRRAARWLAGRWRRFSPTQR